MHRIVPDARLPLRHPSAPPAGAENGHAAPQGEGGGAPLALGGLLEGQGLLALCNVELQMLHGLYSCRCGSRGKRTVCLGGQGKPRATRRA